MRVLAIYHATLTPDGLAIFKALAATSGIELFVIAPSRVSVNKVYDPRGYLELKSSRDQDSYTLIPSQLIDPAQYTKGWMLSELFDTIDRIKPDVIHVFDEAFSVAIAQVSDYARKTNTPLVFYAFENMPLANGIRSRLRYWKAWRGVSGGGAATNEAARRLHEVGFSKSKPIDIIPWCIDTDIFKPVSGEEIRSKIGNPEFVIGFVGRLADEKGVNVLLDALKTLDSSVNSMFIGSGPLEPVLQDASKSGEMAGRLHVFPAHPAPEIAQYYGAMDCLVVPSLQTQHWKEQFGRVIPEAMACGVPVIGSDSGAIPDVLRDAGIITKEGDSKALANAINTLRLDSAKRAALSEKGKERVTKNFTADIMARNLTNLYSKVATNK